ncbi:MAG: isochorismatase [Phormidesmis priestleyi]|uniref:Isochorismatase n=1 Tax=Phormidesmis priestleyi TaxID=268141 RepID=A0A2W4WTT8_9CYAN|nr:MAG: isochorismatase [Phormidesmis priestleyi]
MTTPLPDYFTPNSTGQLYRVPYQTRASEAKAYAAANHISPADTDQARVCLLAIDVQNTFCLPDFELFVGGRSGMGAVDDTRRLCEFIYRNLDVITEIIPTLDTHIAAQIFHPIFWIDEAGEHPAPMTLIPFEAVQQGKWRVNPAVAKSLSVQSSQSDQSTQAQTVEAFALHYAKQLSENGKYPLTIWPYHSMLGGVGHALVSAFEEACFFHNMVRRSQTRFEIKGDNPLTENYSILSPEVLTDDANQAIAQKNNRLIQHLLSFDAVIIAGQAKSHCVAWTVRDLLSEIQAVDPALAQKVYLLNDCTSPVVVPGVVDFTDSAAETYQQFAQAGMNIVQSVDTLREWPHFANLMRI